MEAIILVGLQGSGKSTFYKARFFDTHVRINLDMLKTRHREELLLTACIEMKQPFAVDNTNPTIEQRARYIQAASAAGFRVTVYYFTSTPHDCIQRNAARQGKALVPPAAIMATAKKLQVPTYAEGFEALYIVQTVEEGEFVVQDWLVGT